MYVVRRVWQVEPRMARRAATIAAQIAKEYEDAGQRSGTRIAFNGGTMPGERNRIWMEWIEETLQSPYRADNQSPAAASELSAQLRQITTDSWVEIDELFTDEKAQHD